MNLPIIVISRQFGSGGHVIAERLSESLGIPLYDKDIISKTSADYGVPKDVLEKSDERRTNSFLYALATMHVSSGIGSAVQFNEIVNDDRTFMLTSETIKRLSTSPCIFVGRCADFVLRDKKIVSVFVCADLNKRVKTISERLSLDENKSLKLIKQTDKRRAAYYNSFTDRDWGVASNYDLCINTTNISYDYAANVISEFVKGKYPQ